MTVKEIADITTTPHATAVAPTTTAEQQMATAGQRRVNIIWEGTQTILAFGFTGAYVYASLTGVESTGLANAMFVIIGFYFGRTNHQRVGGVGGDAAGTR